MGGGTCTRTRTSPTAQLDGVDDAVAIDVAIVERKPQTLGSTALRKHFDTANECVECDATVPTVIMHREKTVNCVQCGE
jgi:hypothetical protein